MCRFLFQWLGLSRQTERLKFQVHTKWILICLSLCKCSNPSWSQGTHIHRIFIQILMNSGAHLWLRLDTEFLLKLPNFFGTVLTPPLPPLLKGRFGSVRFNVYASGASSVGRAERSGASRPKRYRSIPNARSASRMREAHPACAKRISNFVKSSRTL